MDSLKARQNQRSYQRGVHKGERIDQGDYFWDRQLNVMSGIQRQMRTDKRFSPIGSPPQHLINDGKPGLEMQVPSRGIPRVDSPGHVVQNPRAAALARLAPGWS